METSNTQLRVTTGFAYAAGRRAHPTDGPEICDG